MKEIMKVAVVVVTYNRKTLLVECLRAILGQTYQAESVIVIDNASTDGTSDLLKAEGLLNNKYVVYHRMKKNTGGAGGFYEGIKLARNEAVDWVWIMDDDTIPQSNCLEMLMKKSREVPDASFLASCVNGINGEPMNVPVVDKRSSENGYPYWYQHLEKGMIKIESATFVSLLININAIKMCGLPCQDYFIWGDDTEYTRRLTHNFGNAYMVGNSKVCHKRKNAMNVHLKHECDKNRMKNYFYQYRNRLVNYYIYDGIAIFLFYIIRFEGQAFSMLLSGKDGVYKFGIVQEAIFASFTRIRNTRNFIKLQMQNKMKDSCV